MSRDPATKSLAFAVADADERIATRTNEILRYLCGGLAWNNERVIRARAELIRALGDRDAACHVQAELCAMDAELKGKAS